MSMKFINNSKGDFNFEYNDILKRYELKFENYIIIRISLDDDIDITGDLITLHFFRNNSMFLNFNKKYSIYIDFKIRDRIIEIEDL